MSFSIIYLHLLPIACLLMFSSTFRFQGSRKLIKKTIWWLKYKLNSFQTIYKKSATSQVSKLEWNRHYNSHSSPLAESLITLACRISSHQTISALLPDRFAMPTSSKLTSLVTCPPVMYSNSNYHLR